MEIRIHGRGGQGGVTCAKLLAAIYARRGKSVQAFGDYAGERSGAPVRAYVRVDDEPITNRNKVYRPDHVLVLDRTLLDAEALEGMKVDGLLLVNADEDPESLTLEGPSGRRGTVDATEIARRHGIGTRSVVIVNTTIAGAFARAMDLPWEALEGAYGDLGLSGDLEAAREAWDSVRVVEREPEPDSETRPPEEGIAPTPRKNVVDLVEHRTGPAPALKTGTWRSQTPIYAEHLSPCNAVCPAGNDVVGFVQALATEGEDAAAEILARTTPLPAVCGRVCPGFCMDSCNRAGRDGAVQVRALERWVADRVRVARRGVEEPLLSRRIAVVGGGPAGLSAAYTLVRRGHRAMIYEAGSAVGGLLKTGIPEYRLPREVLEMEIRDLLELGVEVRSRQSIGAEELEELSSRFDGVVVATGQQRRRRLEVPGRELSGVVDGLDFLARSATERERTLEGQRVVVIGGGNTAVDCSRTALRRGADGVTIAYRRGREEMPAIREELEEAEEEGVSLSLLRSPVAFYGNGRVTEVELVEMRLGEPDASGRRRPVEGDGRESLPADLVLLALGQSADESILPAGWAVEEGICRSDGAELPVVLAGDLATGEGTVTHAIGDGRRSAELLLSRLGEPATPWKRPDPNAAVPPERIRTTHFPPSSPKTPRRLPARTRSRSWAEVNQGLSGPGEAERCFACGSCTQCDTCLVYCPEGAITRNGEGYLVDYDICKGCGICVVECPRDGMEMIEGWATS